MLGIELAGIDIGQFDMLDISGDVVLEGALDVSLINGFELDAGQEFMMMDIDGLFTGQFAGFGGAYTKGQPMDSDLLRNAISLPFFHATMLWRRPNSARRWR